MYIQRSEATVAAGAFEATKESEARVHEFMRTMPGFRWAMLLRSPDERVAAVSMWLTPQQASVQDAKTLGTADDTHGYDVATARGSMTPATHAVLVDWEVDDAVAQAFTSRWNAYYHAIEDRIGSRLLRDLATPGQYAGLHVVTDEANLNLDVFGSELREGESLALRPRAVRAFKVEVLTEGA